MENNFSDLWSLNKREKIKGLLLALGGAIFTFIWQIAEPLINEFFITGTFDFVLFTDAVNFSTIFKVAIACVTSYYGITYSSGVKVKK